jgi:5'-deoxynucleotidase YfbR-like HD superfamily hydrolase
MTERFSGASNLRDRLGASYKFMAQLYKMNWKVRFGESAYMPRMAQQGQIDQFLESTGQFEPVSGHTFMMFMYHHFLMKNCPAIAAALNEEKVQEYILMHDVRETNKGDVSAVKQLTATVEYKDEERIDLEQMVAVLPADLAEHVLKLDEDMEAHPSVASIDVLYVKMIDSLQAGHCILFLGENLQENSKLLEVVMRRRSVERAKNLIDKLMDESKFDRSEHLVAAAMQVKELMEFHIAVHRDKGITLDFSDLGFN